MVCLHPLATGELGRRQGVTFLCLRGVQLTYPLDTLRLRLAVDPGLRGMRAASAALFREGAYPAFFRGLGAALIGVRSTPCASDCYSALGDRCSAIILHLQDIC